MTATAEQEISAYRPGVRAWAALISAEIKMVVRDTAGLIVPLGLPLLILVMNGMGAARQVLPDTGGLTALDVYVIPLVFTIVIATIGMVNMPSFLAYYRRTGVLRRLGVTPAHPAMVLVAQVAASAVQTVIGVGLAYAVAVTAFGVRAPENIALALSVLCLAALAMYAVGMLVAAVAPTGNSSVAIGLVLFFVMGAVGGLFGPVANLPEPIARIGELLPFGAAVQAVGAAWTGDVPHASHLLGLVGATLVSGLVAARFFRWD